MQLVKYRHYYDDSTEVLDICDYKCINVTVI